MAATIKIDGTSYNLTTYPTPTPSGLKPTKIQGINATAGTQEEYIVGKLENIKIEYDENVDIAALKEKRDSDVLVEWDDKKFNMAGCCINSEFPVDTEKKEVDLGTIEADDAYFI